MDLQAAMTVACTVWGTAFLGLMYVISTLDRA